MLELFVERTTRAPRLSLDGVRAQGLEHEQHNLGNASELMLQIELERVAIHILLIQEIRRR